MITTSQFSRGLIIKYEGQLFEILEFQLVKMQQRQPIVRTKLRNIKTGNVTEPAFRSGDKFEEIYLDEKPIQYLYRDGDRFYFMDTESYHEVIVSKELLGEKAGFLKENSEAAGKFSGEELLLVQLPSSVALKVAQTEPGIRGDTAKGGSKPAVLETGVTIKVPLFINTGDEVKVDTRTGEYVERA
ncbi:MAG: elongation factor P [Candidatus Omnitrophica bacterium]|nr:elongation factor P [Candidatus Omnitrophota bacterium]